MKFFKYFLIFIFTSLTIQAQENPSPYISAHFGAYSSSSAEARTANGIPGIVFGAGFGFPIYKDLSLFNKITYVLKSGYKVTYLNTEFDVYNSVNDVNASFSQLIYNGGLQYKFYISESVNFGVLGGLTYSLINHEARLTSGELIQSMDNEGIFGYFAGVNLEKRYENEDLSLYGEAIYNRSKDNVVHFNSPFTGMNYTFGFRYYFISN